MSVPRSAQLRLWTRKIHNYLGLYFLFFIWLFALSGLLLNHSKWPMGQFWNERVEKTSERAISPPSSTGDVAMALELMTQLSITGEVGETRRSPQGERLDFQVVRPGQNFRVEVRLDSARAKVTEIRLNAWGVMDALHKFTGVAMDDGRTRDWMLTRVWSLAMDAVAIGLVLLVLGGLYLWYRLPAKRLPGLAVLAAGVACCAFFLFGLGVLFG